MKYIKNAELEFINTLSSKLDKKMTQKDINEIFDIYMKIKREEDENKNKKPAKIGRPRLFKKPLTDIERVHRLRDKRRLINKRVSEIMTDEQRELILREFSYDVSKWQVAKS